MSGIKRRIDHLFVYGTLRPALGHRLQRELRRHARWLGAGRTTGSLYELGAYPGLVLDVPAGVVHGDVYRLRHARALLRSLDRYEACPPRQPQPREYLRLPVQVLCGRRRVWAWAYLYNRLVTGRRRLSSGDYLAGLARYRDLRWIKGVDGHLV